MFAIELNTSSDCAREIRGTASIDIAVIGRRASTSTTSGFNAGASSATNVAPGFIRSSSSSAGALIANTTSAVHGVPDGRARPRRTPRPGSDAPSPAPGSTTTS